MAVAGQAGQEQLHLSAWLPFLLLVALDSKLDFHPFPCISLHVSVPLTWFILLCFIVEIVILENLGRLHVCHFPRAAT